MHDHDAHLLDAQGAGFDGATAKRNRFFRGKQMKAEEYTLEQSYGIERRRLLNRAVVGWGVVYGLGLRLEPSHAPGEASEPEKVRPQQRLQVSSGLALDRHGREIGVAAVSGIGPGNTFGLIKNESGVHLQPADKLESGRYLLSIHYAEHRFGDARFPDECGCDKPEKNYVSETAVFSLTRLDDCEACPCAEANCQHHSDCCARTDCDRAGRGPHAQLCHWVTHTELPQATRPLCEWRDYFISPSDPVPLACVTLTKSRDACHPMTINSIDDDCGPRRVVKNNDLLYDLLRGCDLTHVSEISWQPWHRAFEKPVSWHDFTSFFEEKGSTRFSVTFSKPVLKASLTPDTMVMTAYARESSTGWIVAKRVPSKIDVTPTPGVTLPPDTTDRVQLHVNSRWYRDEIDEDQESWLSETDFTVEIAINGDMILDCSHQSLDANARGLKGVPSGNGSPGGTFVSSFRVQSKPKRSRDSNVGDSDS